MKKYSVLLVDDEEDVANVGIDAALERGVETKIGR